MRSGAYTVHNLFTAASSKNHDDVENWTGIWRCYVPFSSTTRAVSRPVLHLAALKAVGESVQKPLEYYENNVGGALNLLRCCKEVRS